MLFSNSIKLGGITILGLPKNTELNKQIPKKTIYTKFKINSAEKERIDSDIAKIYIINEIVPEKVNITPGEKIHSFYVLQVILKKKEFSKKILSLYQNLFLEIYFLFLNLKTKRSLRYIIQNLCRQNENRKKI